MSGTHRADVPARILGPGPVLAAVVLALLIAGGIWYFSAGQGAAPHPPRVPVSPTDPTSPAPASGQDTAATSLEPPNGAPPATEAPDPAPGTFPDLAMPTGLTPVSENPPRRLIIPDLLDTGFDNATEPVDGELVAPTARLPSRWESRGEPGSPGSDTVFIAGRMSSGAVFERLDEARRGTTFTLRTYRGDLVYRVVHRERLPRVGLLHDTRFTAPEPGRVVLVGNVYRDDGDRAERDLVLIADLVDVTRP